MLTKRNIMYWYLIAKYRFQNIKKGKKTNILDYKEIIHQEG